MSSRPLPNLPSRQPPGAVAFEALTTSIKAYSAKFELSETSLASALLDLRFNDALITDPYKRDCVNNALSFLENSERIKTIRSIYQLSDLLLLAAAHASKVTVMPARSNGSAMPLNTNDNIILAIAGICTQLNSGGYRAIPSEFTDALDLALDRELLKGELRDGIKLEDRKTQLLDLASLIPDSLREKFNELVESFSEGISTPDASILIDVVETFSRDFKRIKSVPFLKASVRFQVDLVADLLELQVAAFIANYPHTQMNRPRFVDNILVVVNALRHERIDLKIVESARSTLGEFRSVSRSSTGSRLTNEQLKVSAEFFPLLDLADALVGKLAFA